MKQRLMRLAILAHIAGLGWTGGFSISHTLIQKAIYLVQSGRKVDLGYRYKVCYGPYCEDVWADLTYLEDSQAVTIKAKPSGFGYNIYPGSCIGEVLRFADDAVCREVDGMVDLLGRRPVRELECIATTHFVYRELAQEHNNVSQDDVVDGVIALKPHLTTTEIGSALSVLRENSLL